MGGKATDHLCTVYSLVSLVLTLLHMHETT